MLFRRWRQRLFSRRLVVHSFQHQGFRRYLLLYIPHHHLGRGPLPLVFALHGGGGNPRRMARISRFHLLAEKEGFIVVYPGGAPRMSSSIPSGGLGWNAAGTYSSLGSRAVNDVDYIRDILARLQTKYPVDPTRVYAAGMSLGGMMAYKLACRLSDKLAAVAVVAGTMTTTDCSPVSPVAILHIHGSADQRVPLAGGRGPRTHRRNSWPPVRDGIIQWCRINRCDPHPSTYTDAKGVTHWKYTGEADVELCVIENGRHVWPRATAGLLAWLFPSRAAHISATENIWQFFKSHPRGSRVRHPSR